MSSRGALFGRDGLRAAIAERLAAGGGVALHGPPGIGKSVLLDAIADDAAARGDLVLRLRPDRSERAVTHAAIADLLTQLAPAAGMDTAAAAPPAPGPPPAADARLAAVHDAAGGRLSPAASVRPRAADGRRTALADAAFVVPVALPPAQRAALSALQQGLPPRPGSPAQAARLVLPLLLAACARDVLLVIDDAQWLDAGSAGLIAFAMRRRPGPRVRVVAAQRSPDPAGKRRAARLCPAPVLELAVPPLAADDLTDLLEARGLPCRTASRLREASGGNPFLALALGEALPAGPAWRPAPLPEPARELLRERLAVLPPGVAGTLTVAALAHEPTTGLLLRAGRADADRHLRLAEAAGLIVRDGDAVRFTPPVLAAALIDDADAETRALAHDDLAGAATEPTGTLWHLALRSGRPDAPVARELAAAAARAAGTHAARTAAELYLLAAARCPATLAAERRDWLLAASGIAAACGAPELAGRAAEAVLAADSPPGHRVRARLVLIDLAGQALAEMAEMFAAALVEAGDDPGLLAQVRLRRTWAAMIGGDPDAAAAEAGRTAADARRAGDPTAEAMALAALAQVQRLRGDQGWNATLGAALALPADEVPSWLHMGPRYLAARFAMIDDRLDESRDELLRLLAVAEHDRTGEALVEVLRSLSELATRAARCRDALRYAHRAVEAAQRAALSPGPTWYTAAVAELAGGSLAAAAGYARRGVRASEQEGDSIFLRRNLHALGQALLRSGDTRGGVTALRRLRDLEASYGTADPMIVRWRGDLAGGLAALGEHEEAAATLSAARDAAQRLGISPGMVGYLDRASAVVLSESGQADTAVILSAAAALHFEQLQQPIEQGHALLVQGGAERRRRRYAAARVAIGAALAIFLAAEARPWTEQTERALAGAETGSSPPSTEFGLTSTEARIAGLVRDGASNREIAGHLYLSVKTVEATLTRVYRKLGVRSRTQLASRLQGFSLIR